MMEEESQREMGLLKRRLRGDLLAVFSLLTGGCRADGARL